MSGPAAVATDPPTTLDRCCPSWQRRGEPAIGGRPPGGGGEVTWTPRSGRTIRVRLGARLRHVIELEPQLVQDRECRPQAGRATAEEPGHRAAADPRRLREALGAVELTLDLTADERLPAGDQVEPVGNAPIDHDRGPGLPGTRGVRHGRPPRGRTGPSAAQSPSARPATA